jgi:hypothetical protein
MDIINDIIASINPHEVSVVSLILLIFAGVSVVVASGFQLYMKIRYIG